MVFFLVCGMFGLFVCLFICWFGVLFVCFLSFFVSQHHDLSCKVKYHRTVCWLDLEFKNTEFSPKSFPTANLDVARAPSSMVPRSFSH